MESTRMEIQQIRHRFLIRRFFELETHKNVRTVTVRNFIHVLYCTVTLGCLHKSETFVIILE